MSIQLYPSIAKIKRNGVYENLPGFVPETGSIATQQMIATSESSATAQYVHNKGEYFRLNDTLYQAIVKINVGDSIVVGTNCEVAVLGNDVTHIANSIAEYELGIATAPHNTGEYFMVGETLYVATADIDIGDSISTSTNCRVAVVGDELSSLQTDYAQLDVTVNGVVSVNYTEGKNLSANSVSNTIIDDADSCISDYIAIPTGVTQVKFWYKEADTTVQNPYQIWFFDSSYSYIIFYGWNGAASVNRTVNGPTNAAYARFSFNKNYVGKLTENSNTPSVIYYEAGQTIEAAGLVQKTGNLTNLETTEKTNLVDAINEVKNSIPDFPITPIDTNFFHISKNMIDPATCVIGELVNQGTGAFQSASDHNRTTYIEIEPNTNYVVRELSQAFGSNLRYVFYTSAKAYISGAVGALPDMLLTSPANAKYIVISAPTNPVNMMIALYVDEDKSFEAFGNVYVKTQYIVAGDADDIILNVPEKIYALVGYELNIYFDNITENSSLYKWDVTCTKGMQLERGYRITPVAADVGEYTLTIRASISENIYKEVSTTLVVTAATAGSGETATVIVLGDSTTDNGGVITKLHEDFGDDVMSVSTLGTRGTAPNNHEGRSGWNFNDYLTKASITYPEGDPRGTIYNPFYNPTTQTFDASYYFTNSGIAIPDWFFVNLGINDVFGYANDAQMNSGINTVIERCNTVIESILDATTTTKVGICLTIPCNHSQDAFGKAYGCSQTRDRCKRNNTFWVKKMIEEYSGRENERIYIIPINASLDTIYNMGMESIPVNSRNETTYSSPIANGGVHPYITGYWQIADVYTALIKAYA